MNGLYLTIAYNIMHKQPAVSHIPQFGDANTSLAKDAVSPSGDVDVSAGHAHL
jgi:hypothetical protein